ncbi:MAG: hypothetical protein WDO74_17940 [Pseudomonadota bacterium]
MTFKRVNDFTTENPVKLDRELAQLEDNITAEFDLLRKQTAPQLQVVTFTASASRGIVSILPDQQLSVDTSIATGFVVLPLLVPSNFGRKFVLIKRSFTGSIITSCQDSTVLCNGAGFPTISAIGVTTFHCDSTGYFR